MDNLDADNAGQITQLRQQLEQANVQIETLNNEKNELNQKIDALKQQNEEQEEDIEDLEDDNKDLRKDNAELKNKNKSLNETVDKLNSDNIKINEEKKHFAAELKEKNADLTIKGDSLSVVRDILKAKDVIEMKSDYTDTYRTIDNIKNYIENEVKPFFKKIKYNFNDEEFRRWELIGRKHWLKGKTCIAFIGGFSAGKTSVINEILSQGKSGLQLPVTSRPTTAIPTYISYTSSDKDQCQLFSPDNKLRFFKEDTLKKIDHNVLDNIDGWSKLIKYFIISTNISSLRSFSILDTPGFDSQHTDDDVSTQSVIEECDALFWVIDVNDGGVKRSSLDQIGARIYRKPLYIIINKCDSKPVSEIQRVEDQIIHSFKSANIPIAKIIRFQNQGGREHECLNKLMQVIACIPHSENHSAKFIDDLIKQLGTMCNAIENQINELGKEEKTCYDDIQTGERHAEHQKIKIDGRLADINKKCCDVLDTIINKKGGVFSTKYTLTESDLGRICGILDELIGKKGVLSELKGDYELLLDAQNVINLCRNEREEKKEQKASRRRELEEARRLYEGLKERYSQLGR